MFNIVFIGFGRRSDTLWRHAFMPTGECRIAAIADPMWETIKAKGLEYLADCHYYATAEEMLEKEKPDGVVIGTSCDLHTKYALLVAKYGLPLFLEKPVSINEEQRAELETILPTMNDKTVVSFPLRITEVVKKMKELLDSGIIGEIAQVQAINNVPYGRCYFHGWYRDDSRTGGLFLQKATHDLDYLTYLIGQGEPRSICAVESKMVFKGDKPAGMSCKDCPEADTCPESLLNMPKDDPQKYGSYCCFAKDTGNHDSATVIMQYENGLHAVYTQNFIVRKTAGKRGARFVGFKGTLEFDFNTPQITFTDHFSDEIKIFRFPKLQAHGGGDALLGQKFVDAMKGIAIDTPNLADGISSVKLCLAAKKSAEDHTFTEIR